MSNEDEFFVGYLPTPPGLRGYLRVTLAVLFVVILGLSAVIAANMRPTGPGTWDTDHVTTLTGILHVTPYPFIEIRDSDGSAHGVLLVEEGKHGARRSLLGLHDQVVSAKGALISRHGQSMLELAADKDPDSVPLDFKSVPTSAPATPLRVSPGSFRGEFFDPKCFMGAMKPGQGKTHKGCAALCLRGGIPPMFASIDAEGRITGFYVLVDPQGEAIVNAELERVIDLVGEPVECEGVVGNDHGLITLNVDPNSITRRDSK